MFCMCRRLPPSRNAAALRCLFTPVVRKLDACGASGFDEKVDEVGYGFAALPIPLQFTEELDRGDELAACLFEAPIAPQSRR